MTYNPNFTGAGNINAAKASTNTFTNNTGLTIVKGTPVKVTGSGISPVDVSSEAEVDAITGVVVSNIPNLSPGEVMTSGRLEDITTTATVGSVLYLSTLGTMTDVKPDVGVGGFDEDDFVVIIGIVVTNEDNPTKKDLLVRIQTVGQL